ncbi:hypothetical protein PRIPAC_91200 [Pristionchus pacificus]|uniref:Uncharacterized protein n=1 Tax=Pristionchus pacificus TaxID=54126 RepID=A0A2A6CYX6_PRIPA|nr:hypothetical protein PRIPAC_91200 [Pristionchus pacificus]|eukprot:PDM83306.1 hypothetical protein PRIPAC_34938 [Pristionchus pacificus]
MFLVEALKKFAKKQDSDRMFEIREDEDVTPLNTRCSSPILSGSPGLLFPRNQPQQEIDSDEGYFSPRSSSTPLKSTSSSPSTSSVFRRSISSLSEIDECRAEPTTSTLPSETPLKRKGLTVTISNISAPTRKRIRFEEHSVDYESIDKQAQVDYELDTASHRLDALETMPINPALRDLIGETKLRRRALISYKRSLQRRHRNSKKINYRSQ